MAVYDKYVATSRDFFYKEERRMKQVQVRAKILGFLFTVLKVWLLLTECHCDIHITRRLRWSSG